MAEIDLESGEMAPFIQKIVPNNWPLTGRKSRTLFDRLYGVWWKAPNSKI